MYFRSKCAVCVDDLWYEKCRKVVVRAIYGEPIDEKVSDTNRETLINYCL